MACFLRSKAAGSRYVHVTGPHALCLPERAGRALGGTAGRRPLAPHGDAQQRCWAIVAEEGRGCKLVTWSRRLPGARARARDTPEPASAGCVWRGGLVRRARSATPLPPPSL